MQSIIPNLWFNDNAEEAVKFYTSLFKDSKILHVARYGKEGANASGMPEGSVMTISFALKGQEFIALNGGPVFTFSPAISLMVQCDSQKEIDLLWEKLSSGGSTEQCGWLKDKYGISWQIVPRNLGKFMQGPNASKVMAVLLKMKKLDIASLEKAAE